MPKTGKTPSLIGGSLGSCHFVRTGAKRFCKRCDAILPKGTAVVEVRIPGRMGNGKTFCNSCFSEILDQSAYELDRLRNEVADHT